MAVLLRPLRRPHAGPHTDRTVRPGYGIHILIKNGKDVAQGHSSVKIVESIPCHVTSPDDQFQWANLLFVRNDMYFLQHLHCVSNSCALITPALPVVYYDKNAEEHQMLFEFLVDTGSTSSCLPQRVNPFPLHMAGVDVETGVGLQRQGITKMQVTIDDQVHSVIPRARVTTFVNERKRSFTLNYVPYYDSKWA